VEKRTELLRGKGSVSYRKKGKKEGEGEEGTTIGEKGGKAHQARFFRGGEKKKRGISSFVLVEGEKKRRFSRCQTRSQKKKGGKRGGVRSLFYRLGRKRAKHRLHGWGRKKKKEREV